jgi:D-alanyl-lipoteichoic acid acyltransferase DltB (MBOAT superfamily)
MAEFWRRWHISLSSWFRDYLYIPLGGSRVGTWITIRNLLIVFIVSGFWHGANWTFVAWGALNAIYVIPLFLTKTNRKNLNIVAKGRLIPNIKELSLMLFTFLLTVFTWIFFRANDVSQAIGYILNIFSSSLFSRPNINTLILKEVLITIVFIGLLILMEWNGRESKHALENLSKKWSPVKRNVFYFGIICVIFIFGNWGELDFIYFQF